MSYLRCFDRQQEGYTIQPLKNCPKYPQMFFCTRPTTWSNSSKEGQVKPEACVSCETNVNWEWSKSLQNTPLWLLCRLPRCLTFLRLSYTTTAYLHCVMVTMLASAFCERFPSRTSSQYFASKYSVNYGTTVTARVKQHPDLELTCHRIHSCNIKISWKKNKAQHNDGQLFSGMICTLRTDPKFRSVFIFATSQFLSPSLSVQVIMINDNEREFIQRVVINKSRTR